MRWLPWWLTWWLLVLPGCLLAMRAPHERAPDCDPDLCPDGYACDTELDECHFTCDTDAQCQDGLVCVFGDCEVACEDEDCPGGFACDPQFNRCHTDCQSDADCRGNRTCCTSDRYIDDVCDDMSECYR